MFLFQPGRHPELFFVVARTLIVDDTFDDFIVPYSITASEELPNSQFVSELVELITKSSLFKECDPKDIQDWMEYDVDDPGYQSLTDDEIN
ncbi:hypothetical protein LAZ67_16000403 [Cordylochernes scorpioides]|uniref:Uncharacterized protein n=1 Tax=Cordylochernes scorpioides TaxID=51811 RepID=A0ABY6LAJ8_9ARAC|nr:hypothetical protein LAZ67_16000403 [Cordylochernes scorpioides]